jgi:hypothetical protein
MAKTQKDYEYSVKRLHPAANCRREEIGKESDRYHYVIYDISGLNKTLLGSGESQKEA